MAQRDLKAGGADFGIEDMREKGSAPLGAQMLIAAESFFRTKLLIGAKCYDAPKEASNNREDSQAINIDRLTVLMVVLVLIWSRD